jgi:hypothetical protein
VDSQYFRRDLAKPAHWRCGDLNLARALENPHLHERLGQRASHHQQTVVAQDHQSLVAEIGQ